MDILTLKVFNFYLVPVADLVFPRGCANSRGVAPTYCFVKKNFSKKKTLMKMEEFGPRGGALPWCPLGSATGHNSVMFRLPERVNWIVSFRFSKKAKSNRLTVAGPGFFKHLVKNSLGSGNDGSVGLGVKVLFKTEVCGWINLGLWFSGRLHQLWHAQRQFLLHWVEFGRRNISCKSTRVRHDVTHSLDDVIGGLS